MAHKRFATSSVLLFQSSQRHGPKRPLTDCTPTLPVSNSINERPKNPLQIQTGADIVNNFCWSLRDVFDNRSGRLLQRGKLAWHQIFTREMILTRGQIPAQLLR